MSSIATYLCIYAVAALVFFGALEQHKHAALWRASKYSSVAGAVLAVAVCVICATTHQLTGVMLAVIVACFILFLMLAGAANLVIMRQKIK